LQAGFCIQKIVQSCTSFAVFLQCPLAMRAQSEAAWLTMATTVNQIQPKVLDWEMAPVPGHGTTSKLMQSSLLIQAHLQMPADQLDPWCITNSCAHACRCSIDSHLWSAFCTILELVPWILGLESEGWCQGCTSHACCWTNDLLTHVV